MTLNVIFRRNPQKQIPWGKGSGQQICSMFFVVEKLVSPNKLEPGGGDQHILLNYYCIFWII